MGIERERKFLVTSAPSAIQDRRRLRQAYVAIDGDRTVRVRADGEERILTVKGGTGRVRTEVEMPLDRATFEELWALGADRSVDKHRSRVPIGDGLVAELDEFDGRHDGLRLVEVEFGSDEEAERFRPPPWFGAEVTDEPWASNAWLAAHGMPDPV
jgi:adenylate cyclase